MSRERGGQPEEWSSAPRLYIDETSEGDIFDIGEDGEVIPTEISKPSKNPLRDLIAQTLLIAALMKGDQIPPTTSIPVNGDPIKPSPAQIVTPSETPTPTQLIASKIEKVELDCEKAPAGKSLQLNEIMTIPAGSEVDFGGLRYIASSSQLSSILETGSTIIYPPNVTPDNVDREYPVILDHQTSRRQFGDRIETYDTQYEGVDNQGWRLRLQGYCENSNMPAPTHLRRSTH